MDTRDHGFSLRLPDDLNVALREQAQAHERSQGAEVRHILRTVLTKDVTQGARAVEHEDRA